MNSSRFSNIATALVLVLLVAAVPAAAVSVSGNSVPASVQVGQQQDVTYAVDDLYSDYDAWTLSGQTELTQVTWTVTTYDQTNAKIEQQQYNGQSFQQPVAASDDVAKVTVRLQGTTPEWSNWTYDPAQQLTLASFAQTQEGGANETIQTSDARPYTTESQQARSAIDAAKTSIADASASGASTQEAQSLLENAVSAYENGNFGNAESLASQAQNKAAGAAQSKQQTNLLLMIAGGVILLLLVAGGVYWYLQQRQTYDRLG